MLLLNFLQLSSTDEKLVDITDGVLAELGNSCPDCAITSNVIDEQYFACDPESPTYITYRARLEGTSETDSNHLLSLIDLWTDTKPSIIVARVQMSVSPECSVAISSLSASQDCSLQATPQTTVQTASSQNVIRNSGAVIGGAVSVILIVAITVVTVSIVSLKIVMHRRRDTSTVWRAEE